MNYVCLCERILLWKYIVREKYVEKIEGDSGFRVTLHLRDITVHSGPQWKALCDGTFLFQR
jgi:hypothetical protein